MDAARCAKRIGAEEVYILYRRSEEEIQGWESLEMAKKYYTPDVDVSLPDDMLPYYDAVFALYNEISTAIITGQRPISDYDTFIQDYYANGGTQLAEYLATVLD